MHWLYSTPGISKLKELKGKRVAVSSIGAATDLLLREVLKRHGLGSAEVLVLGMGVQSTRLGALINGSVDAAMLTFPLNFSAAERGFHELVSFLKTDLVQLSGSVVAQESLLQSDLPLLRSFLKATYKGLQYSRTNRNGTTRILARRLRINEDLAGKIYDVARPGITLNGSLSSELQKQAVDLVFKSADLTGGQPWQKFFDFSLIEEISSDLKAQSWKP
jgi:ABC-type nitrate/sulfonate/bicarbonate transport system substrate-binding protein